MDSTIVSYMFCTFSLTGMRYLYPLWLPGQPHGYNRTVDKMNNCAVMTNVSEVYGWKVENCSARHPFICTNGKI